MKRLDDGSVASPLGFSAAGVQAGVKEGTARKDMALVYSSQPASGAATYTTNRVQAATVAIDREHLKDGHARAVVLNSGNANACTGEVGLRDARRMCALTAEALGIAADEVLVCSTGVIGVCLPMAAIEAGIPQAVAALTADGGPDAAAAIMTTDTVPKQVGLELDLEGQAVRVGGMAKGSGMISPNMATMLSVITTDACVAPGALQEMLSQAVQRSFNCVTVDGDMSTNDTVILLANGAAAATPETPLDGPQTGLLYEGVESVCRELSQAIARDGEGATKLITISVNGGRTETEARQVGLAVANSNLVKTAAFGNDPNWGRILCAVGYSGVEVEPGHVEVSLCGTPIFGGGAGLEFDASALIEAMKATDLAIAIDLGMGSAAAEVFTSDLSYEYVRINAEYTT